MALKIYTKTGDKGVTGLFGGKRLPKSHMRIEAYGTVDELNAHLGAVYDSIEDQEAREILKNVQNRLFSIGSTLASDPEKQLFSHDLEPGDIKLLEEEMDRMDKILPPLKNFILPGGHLAVSFCHIARCVCRRAERRIVELHLSEPVDDSILTYLNRLSDYLFVLGRKIAIDLKAEEIIWKPRSKE